MKVLALISLLLVILLVSLSAYLRLAHSGIGCADWPACYGEIGSNASGNGASGNDQRANDLADPPPLRAADAYRKLVDGSGRALAWATPLHRLVASVLGLFVLALCFTALLRKRQRLLGAALLGLTVYLAILGIRSGSLHDPAVVMGNLAGGFCLLGLLGWLVFSFGSRGHPPRRVALLATVAGLLLCAQILLGGLTSANFAATSCQTLPDCHGGWWPGPALAVAMDLTRTHEVTASGQAVGGEERIAIHRAHRLGAAAVLLAATLAAAVACVANPRFRTVALLIMALVAAEFALGVAAVVTGLPITLAVSHNWFAGLLLLAVLKLLALSTGTAPGRPVSVHS